MSATGGYAIAVTHLLRTINDFISSETTIIEEAIIW
jgi:hypothetical protein